MKILFLGGNLARTLADWMESQGEEVIYREDKITTDDVKKVNPDFIVSYNYKYIISKEIIECVGGKAVNLHISLLPWNRSYHPNVWSFLDDTPKGVTIHYIDAGIDTGDIIIQKGVYIDEDKETLKSSYEILHREIQALFKENWNKIKNGEIAPQKQTGGGACTTREKALNSSPSSKKKDGIQQSENLKNSITEADLRIRNLEADDINDLFDWRNNPDVRKNSFNTNPISWDEHNKWFETMNKDLNTTNYIACWEGNKIGSIRFENKDIAIKVSVMLNPDFIGKGFGSKLIKVGTEKFINKKKINKPIIAEIKKDNIASIKVFQKAGFKESHVTYMLDLSESILCANR